MKKSGKYESGTESGQPGKLIEFNQIREIDGANERQRRPDESIHGHKKAAGLNARIASEQILDHVCHDDRAERIGRQDVKTGKNDDEVRIDAKEHAVTGRRRVGPVERALLVDAVFEIDGGGDAEHAVDDGRRRKYQPEETTEMTLVVDRLNERRYRDVEHLRVDDDGQRGEKAVHFETEHVFLHRRIGWRIDAFMSFIPFHFGDNRINDNRSDDDETGDGESHLNDFLLFQVETGERNDDNGKEENAEGIAIPAAVRRMKNAVEIGLRALAKSSEIERQIARPRRSRHGTGEPLANEQINENEDQINGPAYATEKDSTQFGHFEMTIGFDAKDGFHFAVRLHARRVDVVDRLGACHHLERPYRRYGDRHRYDDERRDAGDDARVPEYVRYAEETRSDDVVDDEAEADEWAVRLHRSGGGARH